MRLGRERTSSRVAGRCDREGPLRVPLIDLKAQYARLRARIDARIRAVLEHGQFILGPEVAELEAALERFVVVGHAIGVSSGTDALKIALMAEGVGPGDAVFVPAFGFVATAETVAAVGAVPVFVDVHPATFMLHVDDLSRRIERVRKEGRLRPRAVVPVDLFGWPADYPAIAELARSEGLFLLADAAQSFGASLKGERVGRLASVTATSFHPSKPLGCYGDGGCIFTDDPSRADLMRSIRGHGLNADGERAVELGVNARLDTLQAGILLAKLEVFESELGARERVARRYDAALGRAVRLPARSAEATSAFAVYSIVVNRRDAVREVLARDGIATRVYYSHPLHLHPAFARYGEGPGSLPVSEDLSREILSLPIHPYLDAATVERICESVTRALA